MDPFPESVKCKNHMSNDVVYICSNQGCRLPLCLRCLKEHSSFHKAHKTNLSLITLTDFKKKCNEKLSSTIDFFLGEIKSFEHYYLLDVENRIQERINEVETCRQNLQEIINNFFENFRHRMTNHLTEMRNTTQSNVIKALENMKKLLAEINNFYLSLDTERFSQAALESLTKRDFYEEFEELKSEAQQRFDKLKFIDVKINMNQLPLIAERLENLIKLDCRPFSEERDVQNLIKLKPPVNKDYFHSNSSQKILHFFQDSTRLLRVIDLEGLKKASSKTFTFEQIDLDIQFDIPAWHKSVITPEGRLFITGKQKKTLYASGINILFFF
jgi:vacuolar-type H+-ATPase subunit H